MGILLGAVCGLLALPVCGTSRNVDVAVTPAVLVSKSKAQSWVTVHANVPLWEVDPDSARLIIIAQDGSEATLDPIRLCLDDCGDLVAKFKADEVRAVLSKPQRATCMFEVYRLDGTLFSGSTTVLVK